MSGSAKFQVGQVVRHRLYPFRGIIFDIDPVFNNTEEWWQAIPEEVRPRKDQPFYHLLAENARDRVHRLRLRAEPAARQLRARRCATRRSASCSRQRGRQLPAAVPAQPH